MIRIGRQQISSRTALLLGVAAGLAGTVMSEGVSLNYDTLSSLEEPLAIEVGDTTVVLRGLLDLPVASTTRNGDDWDTSDIGFVGNVEVIKVPLQGRGTVQVLRGIDDLGKVRMVFVFAAFFLDAVIRVIESIVDLVERVVGVVSQPIQILGVTFFHYVIETVERSVSIHHHRKREMMGIVRLREEIVHQAVAQLGLVGVVGQQVEIADPFDIRSDLKLVSRVGIKVE